MENNLLFLNSCLKGEEAFSQASQAVQEGRLPTAVTGLADIHKALYCSALHQKTKKPLLVICENEALARNLLDDINALGTNALLYCYKDFNLIKSVTASKEYEHQRIDTLSAIADGAIPVVVTSPDAAMQLTLPKEVLKVREIKLFVGQTLEISDFCTALLGAGYALCETVEGEGQFAKRGGIVDVFAVNGKMPFRIEFFGNEIDSISCFDTETQRREENLNEIVVSPALETLCEEKQLAGILKNYLENTKGLSNERIKIINDDIEILNAGGFVPSDRYLPLIYGKTETIFDYMQNAVCVVCDSAAVIQKAKNIETLQNEENISLLENGYIGAGCDKFSLTKNEFFEKAFGGVVLDNFIRAEYEFSPKLVLNAEAKRISAFSGEIQTLVDDISAFPKNQKTVVLAGEERGAKALCEALCEKGLGAVYMQKPELKSGVITVCSGFLASGFELPLSNISVFTCKRFSAGAKKPIRRQKNSAPIGSLNEIKEGDRVVHAAHGIGVFAGVQTIKNGVVKKDYIKIRYSGQDVLYVPVTALDLVSRYIGADSDTVKLNKLGSAEWHKTKTRVRKAVKDMAKEMTELYAKRMAVKGYAFSPDTDFQNDFERRFPYEETPDQLRSVMQIKGDMEKETPMDRLLCGDVGFGKTEVALRAAFKCVCDSKQCAILVPTTLLAMQHYKTALSRIGNMPVTVRLLSRFVSPKQIKNTIKELRDGRADIVIGTHRLISDDVVFKDLGLVIIDEEQRFGVAQKEKLKKLYPAVDILTLSATPIPRTLNMALSGMRDMSVIEEAPGERHPVQTFVLEQNNLVLNDAIRKELRRGGQVYYLHNRVETIYKVAARLKASLPEAKIEVAHGQMGEDELAKVWGRLLEHEIDILVCTTIIETGVDVPNCNTLIIEDADRFGLSQLHQLRGRVGRSARRASAYFCYKPSKALSEEATKRLEAIRQFTAFGAGFNIALRDLEIRGAGSVLGGAQHGNMEAVGYDMYIKLLNDAMNGMDIEPAEEAEDCLIDLNVSAHIPESYITSLSARIGIYKRIADIKTREDLLDVTDELIDRFGDIPKSVWGLLYVAFVKANAISFGVKEIKFVKDEILFCLKEPDSALFLKLGSVFANRVRLYANSNVALKQQKGQSLFDLLKELSNAL